MSLFRPIHHTFAPHVNGGYVLRTLSLLLKPWQWKDGPERGMLRAALAQKFDAESPFASVAALVALLPGDEGPVGGINFEAYTCIVVRHSAAGHVPIYADIDRDTLNRIPPERIRRGQNHHLPHVRHRHP